MGSTRLWVTSKYHLQSSHGKGKGTNKLRYKFHHITKGNHYSAKNGLQEHTIARTIKLKILPITNPPTREKLVIAAARSTSSLRPFNRGLCSSDGAAIWHILDTYPLLIPRASNSNMYNQSELMMGGVDGDDASR